MTDDQQRAREQFEKFAAGRTLAINRYGEYISPYVQNDWEVWQAATAALRAAPEWNQIQTAPEGRLVVVGWLDTEDSHYPENHEFDYLEDGLWAKHQDCVEHAHAVAPPGSQMPKEQPPYQWWMDLPAFPADRLPGASNA